MPDSNINRVLIDRNDCVLIIIDIQKLLIPHIVNRERMIENIVKLIKFSKIIDIPIIVTEQERLGDTVPEIRSIIPETKIIEKVHFSCCSCEEFMSRLKELGKKTLILVGMETHICVAQTAFEAIPEFNVHVVHDAVSSRTIENRQIGLVRIKRGGGVITSVEMLIFELLKRSGTDEFKAMLPLVK